MPAEQPKGPPYHYTPDDQLPPLGRRLRELRQARGWTQAQLAELAGIRSSTVSELETGYGPATLDRLRRVSEPLGGMEVLKELVGLS